MGEATDYIHSAHRVIYQSGSAAEHALEAAVPLQPAGAGPVNLTWAQPDHDAGRYMWPDA
ncbi:hypothetical protein P4U43_17550 [Arthrobacter sp. EH-1B-1]|uniref:Uncharacterized protein n=1 Tax=Arthrobacter vasquezii TaxID=2977629 RepID=A0ABT6D0I4_9MICC|nr:hypothetical protein [Arthrobacter vasquezii]MDF9279590.1 hypothetical protein [Arthrobacter vasquezii]